MSYTRNSVVYLSNQTIVIWFTAVSDWNMRDVTVCQSSQSVENLRCSKETLLMADFEIWGVPPTSLSLSLSRAHTHTHTHTHTRLQSGIQNQSGGLTVPTPTDDCNTFSYSAQHNTVSTFSTVRLESLCDVAMCCGRPSVRLR